MTAPRPFAVVKPTHRGGDGCWWALFVGDAELGTYSQEYLAQHHAEALNLAFTAAVAEAVRAAVGPLRDALMDAEWCVETELDAPMQPSFECCPMCGGLKPGEELDAEEHEVLDVYTNLVGHRKNCALASAIRSAP